MLAKNKTFYKKKKKVNFLKKKLVYGEYGVANINNYYLFWRKYLNFVRLVKLFCRRARRNSRFFWLYVTINIPFTKKSKGSRMGKGKGNPSTFYGLVNKGRVFLELRGFRYGRFRKFFRKLNHFFNNNFFHIRSFPKNKVHSSVTKRLHGVNFFFL